MQAQSYKLRQFRSYSLWHLGSEQALDMSHFVHKVYEARFGCHPNWNSALELADIRKDDVATLSSSVVLAVFADSGAPLCTIKAIRKSGPRPLPLERDFALDVQQLLHMRQVAWRNVFEIGRLAKDDFAAKDCGLTAKEIAGLGDLIVSGIVKFTTKSLDNVWVASLDNAVLALLRRRGFGFEAVGPTIFYLGSETTPVILPIRRWWQENRAPRPETLPVAVK